VGYPKETPAALAQYVEDTGQQGDLRFSLFVGASTGPGAFSSSLSDVERLL
jgi:acetyl-CoA hydrolase